MSGDKDEISIFDSDLGPLQIVVEMDGLVIFVDAKESDVEVVARKGKVVRISAKKCRCKFRCKYQPHVGVLFIFVEVINFAGVECDYVAAQARGSGAILFDGAHGGA